ncbi:MAG: putative quinol monooxygenase [Acidobacteriota bacterium]
MNRRTFLTTLLLAAAAPATSGAEVTATGDPAMYGLIAEMKAAPDQRDALIDILLGGTRDMPGCLSYVIARDPKDSDTLWITEVWDSPESHRASLALPAVQDAISKGRALIAGVGQRIETAPVGGHGLG